MSSLISILLFTTLAATLCSAYPTREHGHGLRTRRWRRFIEPLQVPVETPIFNAPQPPAAPQPTFAPSSSAALPAPTSFAAPEPSSVAPSVASVAAIPPLPGGVPGWYQNDLGFDSPAVANAEPSGQIIGGQPGGQTVNVSVPGISLPALAPATANQIPASAPVPFPPALGSAVPTCQGYYGIKSANPMSDVFAQCVLRNLLPMRNLATVEGLQLGPCGQIGNAEKVFAGCIDNSSSGRMGMSIDGAFCLAYSFMNNGAAITSDYPVVLAPCNWVLPGLMPTTWFGDYMGTVRPTADGTKCLTLLDGGQSVTAVVNTQNVQTRLVLQPCSGSQNQRWMLDTELEKDITARKLTEVHQF